MCFMALLLRHAGATLLAMSNLSQKATPADLLKLLGKRDEAVKDLMRQVFERIVSLDERIAEAKQLAIELRRTKALLETRVAQSKPPGS